MVRMHLHYDFINDEYGVTIFEEDDYTGYTGRLNDSVYQDGVSWTDWNYFQGSYEDVLKEALKWASLENIMGRR